jgi:hypothetical protein
VAGKRKYKIGSGKSTEDKRGRRVEKQQTHLAVVALG